MRFAIERITMRASLCDVTLNGHGIWATRTMEVSITARLQVTQRLVMSEMILFIGTLYPHIHLACPLQVAVITAQKATMGTSKRS